MAHTHTQTQTHTYTHTHTHTHPHKKLSRGEQNWYNASRNQHNVGSAPKQNSSTAPEACKSLQNRQFAGVPHGLKWCLLTPSAHAQHPNIHTLPFPSNCKHPYNAPYGPIYHSVALCLFEASAGITGVSWCTRLTVCNTVHAKNTHQPPGPGVGVLGTSQTDSHLQPVLAHPP